VQILLQLKGAGLVLSTRGATGGYHLAKPPAEISLAAILSVLDRPSRTARRSAEEGVTAVVKTIRGVWDDLETARQRLLEQTTLSELVRRTEENYALTYQI
jgi:Rrf2 family protein